SLHRHPGRRHDDDPRGHRREDQRRAGLLPDEPRLDGERGPEPHRPGLPRGLHQGAPDGVRHRVQSPGEARDGGFARVTAEVARTRPARRSPTDLSFRLEDSYVDRLASREPDWLAADRRAALEAFRALPIESNRLYTPYVDLR